MKRIGRSYLARGFGVFLAALFCFLTGCGSQDASGRQELWVVTEQTTWDRMNGQLYTLAEAYGLAHPDVDIRIDLLPTEKQERTVYLQQLRTEILRGGGPDCYLLPTSNTLILDEPAPYNYIRVEPLFPDVELAMRNGLFRDITALYDTDQQLGKESLNTAIMDAGTVAGVRYVLPLRYDIPIIYGHNQVLEEKGLDCSVLYNDIGALMEAVYATGDPVLAGGILCDNLSVFSDLFDHRTGNMSLDEDTLARYLLTYQKLQSLLGQAYLDVSDIPPESSVPEETVVLEGLDIKKYIYCQYGEPEPAKELPSNVVIIGRSTPLEEDPPEYITEYYPLWIGSMQDAFDHVPLSLQAQTQLTLAPMRSIGGDIVATVTYYGAVGAGCDDPELAYDFLRLFLLEESQWELNRPERDHTKPLKEIGANTSNDLQYPGLIEEGWPVRDRDSLQPLWNARRTQLYVRIMDFWSTDTQKKRMRQIGFMSELDGSNIPFSHITIDQVRFNTTMSERFAEVLSTLNDPASGYTATLADIDTLAAQLIWELRWHISEG